MADVDITREMAFHRQHGRWATVTAVQPPGRYGALRMDGNQVAGFLEKPRGDGGLINGGFFVLSPRCLALIEDDASIWEGEPLMALASELLYLHTAFYAPEAEGGLRHDDPRLAIAWPLPVTDLSPRDQKHPPIDAHFSGLLP